MAHIKVKQPEFWRAPNWIKMQYPPQPNALQNYLTYLFHSIPSSIFGMQKRHTQGPTQSCRQRHCPSTTLGPASVGPRNRIDKKKRLQVIGWNKPVGLTPEKHETKDIIGLRESHHWDQVATSPDSPHQSYSTNQISKIMDSSWKSGRKKHIGSVLATFPPPNRAESPRLPHLLPNLQRQLLEFGVKGVGNVIGAKCPLGKQCGQSGEASC